MKLNRTNFILLFFTSIYTTLVIILVTYLRLSRVLYQPTAFYLDFFILTRNYWSPTDDKTVVFSAYFDNRTQPPSLQLMGAHRGFNYAIFCFLFYPEGVKECLPVKYEYFNRPGQINSRTFYSYRYYCRLNRTESPMFVQVFNDPNCLQPWRNSTLIPVIAKQAMVQRRFGSCFRSPLTYGTHLEVVVSVIEANRLFGAKWFTIYIQNASREAIISLKVYEKLELGEVVDTWGHDGVPKPWFDNGRVLAVNDCLYRNMFRVKYLIITDFNELRVPMNALDWNAVINTTEAAPYGAFAFPHRINVLSKKVHSTGLVGGNFSWCSNEHILQLRKVLRFSSRVELPIEKSESQTLILKPIYVKSISLDNINETQFLPYDFTVLNIFRGTSMLRNVAANAGGYHLTVDHSLDQLIQSLLANVRDMICVEMRQFLLR